jgi:hypothetical protein
MLDRLPTGEQDLPIARSSFTLARAEFREGYLLIAPGMGQNGIAWNFVAGDIFELKCGAIDQAHLENPCCCRRELRRI